ncbi:MAG: hypothetical protein ISR65_16855, partial [Bacteriovoracaceae bacterium]|nr:hypothetical protein [Bacteriovoracaceae bacterium]
WVPSIIFSILYEQMGVEYIQIIKYALCLLLFGLIYTLSYKINKNVLIGLFIASMGIVTANFRLFLRPELFGYIYFVAGLIFIRNYFDTQKLIWPILFVFLAMVWANCHGSYLVSMVMIPLFIAGDIGNYLISSHFSGEKFDMKAKLKFHTPLIIASVAVVLACMINPYGINLFKHSIELSNAKFIKDSVYEWAPTFSKRFNTRLAFYMYVGFLAVLTFSYAVNIRRVNLTSILLLVAFGHLSIKAQRHIAIFALASTYLLAINFQDFIKSAFHKRLFAVFLSAALLFSTYIVFTKGNLVGIKPGFAKKSALSPKALKFIRQHKLKGNVFNSYQLGAQLAFNFFPELQITIDSRIDLYGEKYFKEYLNMHRNEQKFLDFLNKYNVAYIMVKKIDYIRAFRKMKTLATFWRLIYIDGHVVFLKRI